MAKHWRGRAWVALITCRHWWHVQYQWLCMVPYQWWTLALYASSVSACDQGCPAHHATCFFFFAPKASWNMAKRQKLEPEFEEVSEPSQLSGPSPKAKVHYRHLKESKGHHCFNCQITGGKMSMCIFVVQIPEWYAKCTTKGLQCSRAG